ncbi:Disintegrin and metalloproteinase domain-containing protein 12 [Pseudolycoriella hygida]|uniref:Disintegrin and metalloproteinase domain-containing protein 12 n=1 Tax=Pseudolycoriella hygida TaxID=35572 RepID=A0A9Q0MYJ5_9DIPT|nr:Disintegrin and metalloproteinase domain-containing protein 12 [Pseudolycoriella hygida]
MHFPKCKNSLNSKDSSIKLFICDLLTMEQNNDDKKRTKLHTRFNRIRKLNEWINISIFIWIFSPVNAKMISAMGNGINHSPHDFANFEIITPTLQHGRSKRDISGTRLGNGFHVDDISLSYIYSQANVILDLKLNHRLIPGNYFISYQSTNDTDIVQHFTKPNINLCHYEGKIRNNSDSYVAISTCSGIKGVVFDGHDTFYIEKKLRESTSNEYFLFRHSTNARLSTEESGYGNEQLLSQKSTISSRHKRSIYENDRTVRGPYNANRRSLYVEVVLVVDNSIFRKLGSSVSNAEQFCRDVINVMNAMYVPLNIFITLAGMVVWSERDMIHLPMNSAFILQSFLEYRQKILVSNYPNDVAFLLTGRKFEGSVIGKAIVGTICSFERSGGVIYADPIEASVVAATIAHEMGHNLNMVHDAPSCRCQDKACIMSETTGSVTPFHWSSCSKKQLQLALHRGYLYCLRNKPETLLGKVECGNGFVEPGEECDCGLREHCQNPCCDADTCTLRSNASCATGECCDLSTCQLRSSGTVCRPKNGECDLPEYCNGKSEYCPENYFKRDTEICGNGKAYCYEGACQSHDDRCKLLWGPTGYSVSECYANNVFGKPNGNCGYDWRTKTYKPCSKYDSECGLVQCESPANDLVFGQELLSDIRRSYSQTWPYVTCTTIVLDVGLQNVDPGLTPDGAMCGRGKMCVQQKCLPLKDLRERGIGTECPHNCNGHGVCNNKGSCHCHAGYVPPYCNKSTTEKSRVTESANVTQSPEVYGLASKLIDRNGLLRLVYLMLIGVLVIFVP